MSFRSRVEDQNPESIFSHREYSNKADFDALKEKGPGAGVG
jgi:hypothetical protein